MLWSRTSCFRDTMMTTAPSANPLAQLSDNIVLAGAGKMGGAMLTGWLARGLDGSCVSIIEPHPSDDIRALASRGVRLNPGTNDVGAASVLVIAVKPQSFAEAGPVLSSFVTPSTLVVSIMAGIPI